MANLALTVIEPAIRDFGGVVADAELGHLAAEAPSGWPATEVTGAPSRSCERASASERAASYGLRGRGTQ